MGTRRLRDTVRVPFVYVRRMRSVSLFGSHVSAIRPDHALTIRQHEENPRTQTSVALRVQGGPWPVWPQPLGSGRTLPSIEAAGAPAARTPGAAVDPHRRLPRPDALLRRRGRRARPPPAPGFGPRGHGVATGDAQVDCTRDGQRLGAAPRSPAGTRAYIRSPASCPNPVGPGT